MGVKIEYKDTKRALDNISLNCSFSFRACAEINDRIIMPEEPTNNDPITADQNPITHTVELISDNSSDLPLPQGNQLAFNIPLSNIDEQFVTALKVFSNQISHFLKNNLREPQKIGYKAQMLGVVKSEELIKRVYALQDKLRTLTHSSQSSPQDSTPFLGEFQKETLNALAEFLRYAESTHSTQEVFEEEQHRFFLNCLQLRHDLITICETFRIEALQYIINREISQITQQTPSLNTTTRDFNQDSVSQKTYERSKQFALQNHHNFLTLCQNLKNILMEEINKLREFDPSTAIGFRQSKDSPSLLEALKVLNQASKELSPALEDFDDTTPVGANLRLLNSSLLTKIDALRVAIIRREYDKGIALQEMPNLVYLLTEALDSITTFENSYKNYLEKLKTAQQKAA